MDGGGAYPGKRKYGRSSARATAAWMRSAGVGALKVLVSDVCLGECLLLLAAARRDVAVGLHHHGGVELGVVVEGGVVAREGAGMAEVSVSPSGSKIRSRLQSDRANRSHLPHLPYRQLRIAAARPF
jgi:hypothetical protein